MKETIEEKMEFSFEYQTPIVIEETFQEPNGLIISGTLLAEGESKNGNLYTIEEMKNIADESVGKPLKVGVTTRVDPNTNLLTENMHDIREENIVGKIIKTKLIKDKEGKGKIKFWAVVFNTLKFPEITETLKKGWGVSIRGIAKGIKYLLKGGRLLRQILGTKILDVQLVPPEIKRGQNEAKVEEVGTEIQETLIVNEPKIKIVIVPKNVKIKRISLE